MLSEELIGESFIRFVQVNRFIRTIQVNQCTKMNWTANSTSNQKQFYNRVNVSEAYSF